MSIMDQKWLLRWRFDYNRDRPSRMGMWSNSGGGEANQAWTQNKEGVVRACIEGKNVITKEVKPLVECDGHAFRNFQWIAGAMVFSGGTQLLGMRLMMRDKAVEVYHNGNCVVRELSEGEKGINFATYGK